MVFTRLRRVKLTPIITLAAVIPAIIAEMMRTTLARIDSDIFFSFS
jgi:hypothetical protein